MQYETLMVSFEHDVAVISLNRPHVHNALDAKMFDDLEHVFAHLESLSSTRVILLTGHGNRAFAAGADIVELQDLDDKSGIVKSRRGQHVFSRIEHYGKPVIALINGFALGGGCELAMACTLRVAAVGAKLGQPEVKLGLIPGYGGTQRLPRLVGRSASLRLLLTGAVIDADEALRIGLVDEVVPSAQLMEHGMELARAIAANAPLAVAACLDAVQRGSATSLDAGQLVEASLFAMLCATEDAAEGLRAFRSKRSARWTGR